MVALFGLPGCAAWSPANPPLLLRLSPASLGTDLALQQRLTIDTPAGTQQLDALLEVDATTVRLAVLALGQTLLQLEWDGSRLEQSRSPVLPAFVSGERTLSDLQLMLWPADAIQSALPPGWTLENAPHERLLRSSGATVVRIRDLSPTQSELQHLQQHYRIRVDSQPPEAAP